MHPSVKAGSAALRGSFPSNQSFQARITGEGGRLNLNLLAAAAIANPASPMGDMLRKYLEIKGVDLNERDRMVQCLLDWVDPDNLVRINGAEDEPGYKPANAPLKTLDELKRVKGWEEFTSQPNWDADFTLNSTTAQIDINSASRDVLLALPGFTEPLADRFLQMRRGPDDIEGTEDDVIFDAPQVQIALGLGREFDQLGALIRYDSEVVRIVSIGKSGPITRNVRVVLYKKGGGIRLIPGTWKEY